MPNEPVKLKKAPAYKLKFTDRGGADAVIEVHHCTSPDFANGWMHMTHGGGEIKHAGKVLGGLFVTPSGDIIVRGPSQGANKMSDDYVLKPVDLWRFIMNGVKVLPKEEKTAAIEAAREK